MPSVIDSVYEVWNGRTGKVTTKQERDYTRVFRVTTNVSTAGPVNVILATGIPRLYDLYVEPGGGYDNHSSCQSVEAAVDQDDATTWLVTCHYTAPSVDPAKYPDNPAEKNADIEWDFDTTQKPVWQDVSGHPVTNSANDPFDPPLEIDKSRPVFRITRNFVDFDPSIAGAYKDAVNSDTFLGYSAGKVCLKGLRAKLKIQNGYTFWEVSAEFVIDHEGWNLRPVDAGMRDKDDNVFRDPKDGTPLGSPTLLDGGGFKKPKNVDGSITPTYLSFQVRRALPFSALGFL